ncbi:MAG: DMT family transporter [Candidatus Falkowbacteria bacterium]
MTKFNKIINIILKNRKIILFVFLFAFASFLIGNIARADVGGAVAALLGHILNPFIWLLGKILLVLMDILIGIARYNDFIKANPVTMGWTIVRDLCNMFFILILLIIAFATILKIENYNIKRLLPKLLIMAILINFSKTICGVLIDFSQVIMLTFVNGFKDMGGANLTTMLGIDKILSINAAFKDQDVTFLTVSGSMVLALAYIVISVIVIGALVAVLAIRVIMLWIYVVLSPLAFLLSAFPAGQKHASQWWSEFSKQVVTGPILAFFIWLSLVSLGNVTTNLPQANQTISNGGVDFSSGSKIAAENALTAGMTTAATPEHMLKFIISIGMLMGGLIITQQLGGAAGSAAGKGLAWAKKAAGVGLAAKGVERLWGGAKDTAKSGVKATGRAGLLAVGAGLQKVGKEGGDISKAGKFVSGWRSDLVGARNKEKAGKRLKTLQKMGIGAEGMEGLKEVADTKLGRVTKGMAGAGTVIAGTAAGVMAGGVPAMAIGGAAITNLMGGLLKGWSDNKKKGREERIKKSKDKKNESVKGIEVNRGSELTDFKNSRDKDLQGIEEQRLDAIKKIEKRTQKNSKGRLQQTNDTNKKYEDDKNNRMQKYEIGKKGINDKYDNEVEVHNNTHNENIKNINKEQGWVDKQMQEYQPNRVTIRATEIGTLNTGNAKKLVGALEHEDIHKIPGDKFYSPGGQTMFNREVINQLTSSNESSVNALKNIEKTLRKVKENPPPVGSKELSNIHSFKQAIAACKVGGGDVSKLEPHINILNTIDTGDPKGRKAVDDFEDSVITNS